MCAETGRLDVVRSCLHLGEVTQREISIAHGTGNRCLIRCGERTRVRLLEHLDRAELPFGAAAITPFGETMPRIDCEDSSFSHVLENVAESASTVSAARRASSSEPASIAALA